MILTLDQIRSVTSGAVDIFQDETGIHFRRFTQQQMDILSAKSTQFQQRSFCTAGCQLSFYTDSNVLFVDAVKGAKYEILINGLPAYFFPLETAQRCIAPLPSGENLVVITLPNYSEGVLSKIEIDEGSYIRPYTYSKRFLFLGDSITQGSKSTRDSCCYVYRLSQFFDAQPLNLGVGGSYMSADTLEDVGFDPDAVFIAYGTNDYTRMPSLEALKDACSAYFDRVKALYPNKKIFYISPLWRGDGDMVRKAGSLADCRKVMIEQCAAHGFIHIDGYTLIPHQPFYFGDGHLHPNDLGFSFYSQNLIQFLQNYL